ncbi:MAG: hypothetical protein ACSHYB_16340 [Roseibacillus sp.]
MKVKNKNKVSHLICAKEERHSHYFLAGIGSWLLLSLFVSLSLMGRALAEETDEEPFMATGFPLSDQMWLTTARVELRPSKSKVFYARGSGEVRVLVSNGSELMEGQVWAVSDESRVGLDSEALELDRAALQETLAELEVAREDDLLQLEKKLATIAVERGRLEALLLEDEVSGEESLIELVEEGLKTSDLERDRLLSSKADLNARTRIDAARARAELDFRRREADTLRLRKASEFRATFEGELTYLGMLAERVKHVPALVEVEIGDPLAVLHNENHYEVFMVVQSSILEEVAKESLFLRIDRLRKDRMIEAAFGRTEVNPQDKLLSETLVFTVAEEDVERAQKRTLGLSMATIYTRLEKECYLVPKAEFLKRLPEGQEVSSWSEVVRGFWPQAKIEVIGQSVLAISLPKE